MTLITMVPMSFNVDGRGIGESYTGDVHISSSIASTISISPKLLLLVWPGWMAQKMIGCGILDTWNGTYDSVRCL